MKAPRLYAFRPADSTAADAGDWFRVYRLLGDVESLTIYYAFFPHVPTEQHTDRMQAALHLASMEGIGAVAPHFPGLFRERERK
jgi:hypothetical protein